MAHNIEEDLDDLKRIRSRIIKDSGLKNSLEELAKEVANGLDPPSWFGQFRDDYCTLQNR